MDLTVTPNSFAELVHLPDEWLCQYKAYWKIIGRGIKNHEFNLPFLHEVQLSGVCNIN